MRQIFCLKIWMECYTLVVPGPSTGVRMCTAVVQGISFAHNIPTLGLSTLEVIGYGASKKYNKDKVAIALDARMGEVYWAYYINNKIHNESLKNQTRSTVWVPSI